MPRRRALPLLAALLVAGAGATALAGPPAPTTPAAAVPGPAARHAASWTTYDLKGQPAGHARWHWTTAGGNCCEVYVTSTSSGRLLEYGGTWPWYSDDHGATWSRVAPVTPLRSGEGAIVAGPNGNVYGVGWDPYTGDHLQGLRYTAARKSWEVAEAPLHSPFYDREWITYAKGPFTDETGASVPFITLVRGGTGTKQLAVIATDGISYTTPSDANLDVQSDGDPRFFRIRVVKEPAADWWQPNPGTFTLPLNAGGVLLLDNDDDSLGSDAAWLDPRTLKWQRARLAFRPTGAVRQDSRGWLTMVSRKGNDLTLALSPDGGLTWRSTSLVLPESHPRIEGSGDFFDVKVNGRLGQAVVVTRADDRQKRGLDVVWRVDVSRPQPRVVRTYGLGRGDLSTIIGVVGSLSNRFDFPSVTLLPDGRLAASFDDTTTPVWTSADGMPTTGSLVNPDGHSPALAVLD